MIKIKSLLLLLALVSVLNACDLNSSKSDFKVEQVVIADHPITANYTTLFSVQLKDSLETGTFVHWRLKGALGEAIDTLRGASSGSPTHFFYTAPGVPGQYAHQVWIESQDGKRISNIYEFTTDVIPWSPPVDGSNALGKIVFSARGTHGEYQIYSMNADGSNVTELTDWEEGATNPSWSPDGTQIVFESFKSSATVSFTALWIMNADGTEAHLLDEREGSRLPLLGRKPFWSPDGSKILYENCPGCEGGGNPDIYIYDLENGEEIEVTNHPADDESPRWSPDGNRIIFNSGRDYRNTSMAYGKDIYIMNRDGTGIERITTNGHTLLPVMGPDGVTIAFTDLEDYSKLYTVDINSRVGDVLFSHSSAGTALYAHHWSLYADKILYGERNLDQPGLYQLSIYTLETGKAEPIREEATASSGAAILGADWHQP